MKRLVILALLSISLAASLPVYCAETLALADVLSGKACPLSVKMKELTPQWYRFTLYEKPAGGNSETAMMLAIYRLFTQGGNVYYTQGRTADCAGETYLIAYARQRKPLDPRVFENGEPPKFEPLTPDTPLTLSLLNVRTCGSLLDIRQFDLNTELAVNAGQKNVIDDAERKARRTESMNNLRQIVLGVMMCTQDNNEVFPQMPDVATLKPLIGLADRVFVKPGTNEAYLTNIHLSGKKLGEIKHPEEMILVYEASPDVDGTRLAGYADGHVATIAEKDWLAEKKKSGIP